MALREFSRRKLLRVRLSAEQQELLEAFAADKGIKDLATALPLVLLELRNVHDEWWDSQFAASGDVLDKMAEEAHLAYLAGETEEFDPDTDPDLL